jgi:hypothetical protein
LEGFFVVVYTGRVVVKGRDVFNFSAAVICHSASITILLANSKVDDIVPTRKEKKKKEKPLPLLHSMTRTSHWLHGNSIPNIGCHYFWPELRALLKNTLAIKLPP